MGGTYDLMEHNGQEVQKVNRIFATWDNNYGAINKVKIKMALKSILKSPIHQINATSTTM